MTVWMDAVDEAFVIPLFDGRIFLKVSRINESPQRPQTVQRQTPPRSNSVSNPPPHPVISKPPGSSETLLAFGSDDINEDDMQNSSSHQVTAASFMDSNNNDLIGLSSDPITSNIPKVCCVEFTCMKCSTHPPVKVHLLTTIVLATFFQVVLQHRHVRH